MNGSIIEGGGYLHFSVQERKGMYGMGMKHDFAKGKMHLINQKCKQDIGNF